MNPGRAPASGRVINTHALALENNAHSAGRYIIANFECMENFLIHSANSGMTYSAYKELLATLISEGKTTGHTQSETYLNYTRLNVQRMQRIDKTLQLLPETVKAATALKKHYTFLVITEGWCGDAAQSVPVMAAMQGTSLTVTLVLRDDNPELMNRYLTNGSRSIPRLICFETASGEEQFNWGPRPAVLQELVMNLKANGASAEEKSLAVQKWYNADKTVSVQKEISGLLAALT